MGSLSLVSSQLENTALAGSSLPDLPCAACPPLIPRYISVSEEHQQHGTLMCFPLPPTPIPSTCHSSCLPFALLRSECWLGAMTGTSAVLCIAWKKVKQGIKKRGCTAEARSKDGVVRISSCNWIWCFNTCSFAAQQIEGVCRPNESTFNH